LRCHIRAVEQTLFDVSDFPPTAVKAALDVYKHAGEDIKTDDDYYRLMVMTVFYSGFRAQTVTDKRDIILGHFPDWCTTVAYSAHDLMRIASDPRMIKNIKKIEGCAANAREFQRLTGKFGSFKGYLADFDVAQSYEEVMRLSEDMRRRFSGLGPITVLHYLSEIGLPVMKPDRVICRVFCRLGIIQDESDTFDALRKGRLIAQETGQPIRYVDIVFVALGQQQNKEYGIERGLCLKINPACHLCGARPYCRYYAGRRSG
jgi:DNA-3-methyladenine glycosylase I